MDPKSIPSPLPALLQLLPFILAKFPCPIPASLLSDPVVQRHYYMSSQPDTPEYLFGYGANAEATERLQQLAAQGVENVAPTNDIKYTAAYDEENRLIARILIAGWTGRKHALYLSLMWEEAGLCGSSANASSNGQLESAWRFYDINAPEYCTGDAHIWKDTIAETLADVARVHRAAAAEQEQGSEDEEEAAAKYWAGVSDDDDDAVPVKPSQRLAIDSYNDEEYWAEYDKRKSMIEAGEAKESSNGGVNAGQAYRRKSAPSKCGNADAATAQALEGIWNLYRQLKASHHEDDAESRDAFLELARQATLDRD